MIEYCKYCGRKITKSDNVCPGCGGRIEEESTSSINQNDINRPYTSSKKRDFKIALLLMIPAFLFVVFPFLIAFIVGMADLDTEISSLKEETKEEIEDDEDTIGFNEKFIFDDLVISFGSEYEFVSVENTITGVNETQAIKIPITITNIGNKSSKLSPLVYEVYTPFNKTAKNINAYFEDNIDSAQELKEGESYTKYIYVLYDGDGAYKIKFTNQNKEIIIKLEISKNKV